MVDNSPLRNNVRYLLSAVKMSNSLSLTISSLGLLLLSLVSLEPWHSTLAQWVLNECLPVCGSHPELRRWARTATALEAVVSTQRPLWGQQRLSPLAMAWKHQPGVSKAWPGVELLNFLKCKHPHTLKGELQGSRERAAWNKAVLSSGFQQNKKAFHNSWEHPELFPDDLRSRMGGQTCKFLSC